MKTAVKNKKIIEPEDLDGPMMVWPHTPLSPEDQKAVDAWEAERKAAWLAKQAAVEMVKGKESDDINP